jgi:hypothetical protein
MEYDHYPRELAVNPLFGRVKARYMQVADIANRQLSGAETLNNELKLDQQLQSGSVSSPVTLPAYIYCQ